MSQETVELVVQGFRAWTRGDRESAREVFAPDVEYRFPFAAPGQGLEGLERELESWRTSFEDYGVSFVDAVEIGEHVVLVITQRGRGRESGAAVDLTSGLVCRMRGSLIAGLVAYETREEAFAAARASASSK